MSHAALSRKWLDEQVDVSEDEWDGIDEDSSQADEHEEEYENGEQLTTVTVVEDFDPEELLLTLA